jgi:hypothetical protein
MLMSIIVYFIFGYLLSSVGLSIVEEPAICLSFIALFWLIDTKPWQHWNKDETHNKS